MEPLLQYQFIGACDMLLLRFKSSALAYVVCIAINDDGPAYTLFLYCSLAERSSILSALFLSFPRRIIKIWPAYQQSTSWRPTRAGRLLRATKKRRSRTQPVYRHMTRKPSPYSEYPQPEPPSILLMARLSSQPSPTSLFLRNLRYQTVVRWRGSRCWQVSSCSSTLGRQCL